MPVSAVVKKSLVRYLVAESRNSWLLSNLLIRLGSDQDSVATTTFSPLRYSQRNVKTSTFHFGSPRWISRRRSTPSLMRGFGVRYASRKCQKRISMYSRLYHAQHATVKCDCSSRRLHIGKGTKQGYPISPYIFNSVLEQVMRSVQ